MPSNVPRSDTTKKREQLQRREEELKHAIRSEVSHAKLNRAVENLKDARLSLLKAELYWAEDERIRGRNVDGRVAKIQDESRRWQERSVEDILHDYMT